MGSVLGGTILGDPMLWREGASSSPAPAPNLLTRGAGWYGGKPASEARGPWASPWGPDPCPVYLPGGCEGRTRGQSLSVMFSVTAAKTTGRKDEQGAAASFLSSLPAGPQMKQTRLVDGVSETVTRGLSRVPQQTG